MFVTMLHSVIPSRLSYKSNQTPPPTEKYRIVQQGRNSRVQYIFVQNSEYSNHLILQYSTVHYSTVHYITVQQSTVEYNTVQYSKVGQNLPPFSCHPLPLILSGGEGVLQFYTHSVTCPRIENKELQGVVFRTRSSLCSEPLYALDVNILLKLDKIAPLFTHPPQIPVLTPPPCKIHSAANPSLYID